MFRKIAGFELRYQCTSPTFWVTFALLFLLPFAAMTNENVHIGGTGNTLYNAPAAIIQIVAVMSFFALFTGTAFVANVVIRDDETNYAPILRSTPVGKFAYLFGRLTGALGAIALVFAAVPLAICVGSMMPWVDALKLGPFRPLDYLYAYGLIGLPTLISLSAVFFALATATRSIKATYMGVVGFLVLYMVLSLWFDKPEYETTVALFEPFGMGAIYEVTKYWTAADRNTLLPPFSGLILYNRLIWVGVGLAAVAAAYAVFRPVSHGAKIRAEKKPAKSETPTSVATLPQPHFDTASRLCLAWKWMRFEAQLVFKSPGFFVLLAIGLFNAGGAMWMADEVADYIVYPVTRLMINALTGAFTIIPIIIAITYGGDLVWRERERRTHEIVDATPLPDWALVVPKLAAITLVLAATFLVSVAAAIVLQTIKGYTHYEISHYILWYVLPMTVEAAELAALAIFLQVVSPHKYIGWAAMSVYLVALMYLPRMGFENKLYLYSAAPHMPLSDMNGVGHFWIGYAWFHVYWLSAAVLLSILSLVLWRRGTETRLWPRVKRLGYRLRGPTGAVAAAALVVLLASGAWCYYNTTVVNTYLTSKDIEKSMADYEKKLLAYEKSPEPRITSVRLNVAVYPHDESVTTEGSYTIENRTQAPLKQMHIRWQQPLKMKSLKIDGAHKIKSYDDHAFEIYAFDTPMAPGEKRTVRFVTELGQKAFTNGGNSTRIVDNGTFVNNTEIAPVIGMDRDMLLSDPVKRRRYGLPSYLRPPKLEDDGARAFNYLRKDSDFVHADITVSTVADQTPIAPGYKQSETVKGGRRTVHFVTDAPIMHFFSIQSAAYAVKRDRWHNVDLAVYYDPHHPYDVDRMLAAMKVSFDVYEKAFGPFQFRQARILEFPGYQSFAQSFAGTIPYSENIGFIQNYARIQKDPEKIDLVTYVTAHELGHQWWAHQIIGANMQGMTLLSESFAQYSALLVMEKLYGPEHVRKFLKYALDHYLRARGTEEIEELPLARVENQGYIHYDKGALAMYRLKQAVGEDVVDRALRRLLKEYAFKGAPYPSSKDFLKILRAEAGPKYSALITDLFERITIYDLRTTEVKTVKRADGKYDVAIGVEAHKYYADGTGKQTETPLAEDVDTGAFLVEPGKKDFDAKKVLVVAPLPVKTGKQVLHLITAKPPSFAGLDPYNEWIDRNSDDNIKAVTH